MSSHGPALPSHLPPMAPTEKKEELMSTEPCEMDSTGSEEGCDSTGRITKRIRFTVPSNTAPCGSWITDVDSSLEHESSSQTGNDDEEFENEDSFLVSEVEMQVEEGREKGWFIPRDEESIEEIVAGICLLELAPLFSYLGCETTDHEAYKCICSHGRGFANTFLDGKRVNGQLLTVNEDFELRLCQKALSDQISAFSVEFCEQKDLAVITNGGIDLEKYSLLRESHIGFVLECLRRSCSWNPDLFYLAPDLRFDGFNTKGYEDVVGLVWEVMEECNGLLGEKKMHLLLEFKSGNCLGMLDSVLLDAWSEIEIQELERIFEYKTRQVTRVVMCELVETKFHMFKDFCTWATEPLQPYWLGTFSDEVLEVVRNANIRRRWHGQRFVSTSHVFWALRQTKIAAAIDKLCHGVSDNLPEAPAKHPAYGIYKNSLEMTSILGAEKVGIEHLALATVLSRRNLSKQDSDTQELSDFLRLEIVKVFLEDVKHEKEKPDEFSECMGDAERPPGVFFYKTPIDSLVKWSRNWRQVEVDQVAATDTIKV